MKTHAEILSQLAENGQRFEQLVETIPEPLISERPTADEWSIKEILCHLVDIQNVGAGRIAQILRADDPQIEVYDDAKENRERNHRQDDVRRAMATFLLVRSEFMSELQARPERDWQRTGRHPEQENFTVEFILRDMSEHERKHFEQIDDRIARYPRPDR